MDCPVDQGGCGQPLLWEDGAFCKSCMDKAEIQLSKGKIMEDYVNIERICEMLGVTRQTVYKWVSEKGLPAIKLDQSKGAPLRFKESDVRNWFESFQK